MSTLLIKAMLVVGLMFGSVGGTAALAAESLPDSPLYPVKLTMEEARLALSFGPTEQARLHLAMAQERTAEMQQLALQGDVPGEVTLARLQHHLNSAFQLAGQLPDAEMAKLLTEARQMSQTQAQVDEPAQKRLEQANQLLDQAGREVDAGLKIRRLSGIALAIIGLKRPRFNPPPNLTCRTNRHPSKEQSR
jgi:hypothetical protein